LQIRQGKGLRQFRNVKEEQPQHFAAVVFVGSAEFKVFFLRKPYIHCIKLRNHAKMPALKKGLFRFCQL